MLKSAHDLVKVLRILPDGRVLQPESVSGLLVELQNNGSAGIAWFSAVSSSPRRRQNIGPYTAAIYPVLSSEPLRDEGELEAGVPYSPSSWSRGGDVGGNRPAAFRRP